MPTPADIISLVEQEMAWRRTTRPVFKEEEKVNDHGTLTDQEKSDLKKMINDCCERLKMPKAKREVDLTRPLHVVLSESLEKLKVENAIKPTIPAHWKVPA